MCVCVCVCVENDERGDGGGVKAEEERRRIGGGVNGIVVVVVMCHIQKEKLLILHLNLFELGGDVDSSVES